MNSEGSIPPLEMGEKRSSQIPTTQKSSKSSLLYVMVILLMFLAPIFFLPIPYVEQIFVKAVFVISATMLIFALWLGGILKIGRFDFPKSSILLALSSIPIVTLVSALFSENIRRLFIGNGFELSTVVTVTSFFILTFLTATLLNSKPKIFYFYLAFLGSFLVIALYMLIRLFTSADVLSFGVFNSITANPLGGWYDLAVFFGASAILSLVAIELITLSRMLRGLLIAGLVVSVAFLILVNYTFVWVALSALSLLFLVYQVIFVGANKQKSDTNTDTTQKKLLIIPVATLAILLISVFFAFTSAKPTDQINTPSVTDSLSESLGINYYEVHPKWSTTVLVSRQAIKENSILGAGPNTYRDTWQKYKPLEVNQDPLFWGVEFAYARGLVPTLMTETGLLGIGAWLFFFVYFLYAGFRFILSPPKDTFSYYLILSSFMTSLYFWIIAIMYTPSFLNFGLAFLFTGAFIASLAQEGNVKRITVSMSENPKVSFGAVMGTIFLLCVSLSIGYVELKKFIAYHSVSKGVTLVQEGRIDEGRVLVEKGVRQDENNPRFLQTLSEVRMIEINILFQTSDPNSDETVERFSTLYADAVNAALEAIVVGGENYRNYIALGRLYEAVAPLGIPNAYEEARKKYEQAWEYSPNSPVVPLLIARLERAVGNLDSARDFVGQAINLKGNYAEAVFLLSQIEADAGNIERAIESTEATVILVPNDPTLYLQLGLLRYNNEDYAGAANALERAVALNSDYANARYFLGLSYYEIDTDSNERAIAQFEEIERTNPNNEEVQSILNNLRANREPFANTSTTLQPPEEREELPIAE
ncbi:MAG: tetratricopeptide repeat protein [Candidatus Paceibacterota bacterium]